MKRGIALLAVSRTYLHFKPFQHVSTQPVVFRTIWSFPLGMSLNNWGEFPSLDKVWVSLDKWVEFRKKLYARFLCSRAH